MTIADVRYSFEHTMLPKWFFEEGMTLIGYLITEENFAYELLKKAFEDNGMEMPYPKELICFEKFKTEDKILGGKIILPTPNEMPSCYEIFMLFNLAFDNIRFFTVERGQEQEDIVIGEWTKDGEHIDHGAVDVRNSGEMDRVVELYRGGAV